MNRICVVTQHKCEWDQTKAKYVFESNTLRNLPALCRTLWFPPVWLIHQRAIWNITSKSGYSKQDLTNQGLGSASNSDYWSVIISLSCFCPTSFTLTMSKYVLQLALKRVLKGQKLKAWLIFKSWISVNGIPPLSYVTWRRCAMFLSNITCKCSLCVLVGEYESDTIQPLLIGKRVYKNLNSYLIHAQTSSPNRESGTPIT